MSKFSLPQQSNEVLDKLRIQLRSQSTLYKLLQIIVGAILPIAEAVIVNRATDPSNTAANEFWIFIGILAIVHIALLFALIIFEMPLSSFLVEFDEQNRNFSLAILESQQFEDFGNTLRSALVASELSLIGIEKSLHQKHLDLSSTFQMILTPWIIDRAAIFWPQGGNTFYNMAVYIYDSEHEILELIFRSCDDRIKRHDRSWKPGVGHIGLCYSRQETSFCNDMESSIAVTNTQSSRPEDNKYYKSVIAEPIKANNDVIGVLAITSNHKEQFDETIHVQCARIMSQLLGLGWNAFNNDGA